MKNKKNKIKLRISNILIIMAFFLFIVSGVVSALNVDISLDIKPRFAEGDTIIFNYSFISDEDITIKFVPYVDCPNAPKPLLEIKQTELKKGKVFSDDFVYMDVVKNIEPQTCRASVSIVEPIEKSVGRQFEITTNPSFDIQVLICKDRSCTEKSKIFVKGEKAYFDYASDIPDLKISGSLSLPDGSTNDLTLPGNVALNQVGKYHLNIEAQKEGYKTNKQSLEFVVLEGEAKVIDKRVCNANGKCEPNLGENHKTCPQDCLSGSADGYCDMLKDGICDPDCSVESDQDCQRRFPWLLVILGIIIITLIVLTILKIYRQQKIESNILKKLGVNECCYKRTC